MEYKTKHEFVQKEIIKLIEEKKLKPGDRLPSELDFQKQFSVSRHTVRSALNRLEYEGVIVKEQGAGSFVSDQKEKRNVKEIGVITTYFSDYIFPTIIRGIEKELTMAGYSMILASTNNDISVEEQAIQLMMNRNVDGLIVEPTKSAHYNPNIGLYMQMSELGIPIIMINAKYDELDFPLIALDDLTAGYESTKCLIDNNHYKIGGIFKADDRQGKERLKGYIKACSEFDIPYNSKNVIMYETETFDKVMAEEVAEMIRDKRITGLVCYNDSVAIEVLKLTWQYGIKVPDDLSIISYDNSVLSTMTEVKLDSVNHPKAKLGKEAASSMIQLIENPGYEMKSILYHGDVVAKGSVKALNEE
ncbi:hypothetical protein AOC36_11175 [Erysipelothrix larvae]|uniref:HTH gntR-type domain-containing protein n=1 Tax=Erysipelothrix larvae TaxID=1514105 RepID=A0A0X8H1R0_9FIRM|nr:GntR family transcriptional regulator [Erysipelothrix larvae]AMC94512.1 hypothetical protein AOC36_11175 [Erysipelothrix larvae]